MSNFIISEEQLQTFDVATLAEDEYIDSEIFAEIRSRPLSSALEESYKNGFNDGQVEGLVWMTPEEEEKRIRKSERENVIIRLLDEMGGIDGYSGKGAKDGYLVCDDDVKEIISRIRKGDLY